MREKLEFEVMDLPLQYNAILGRPAFARFMAVLGVVLCKTKNSSPLNQDQAYKVEVTDQIPH
jgi:hypothetical protein